MIACTYQNEVSVARNEQGPLLDVVLALVKPLYLALQSGGQSMRGTRSRPEIASNSPCFAAILRRFNVVDCCFVNHLSTRSHESVSRASVVMAEVAVFPAEAKPGEHWMSRRIEDKCRLARERSNDQNPSSVLTGTSRNPSPSSSRAYSPAA